MEYVIGFLLLFIAVREATFYYTLHKLVNKIMSRNYGEYLQAQNLAKAPDTIPLEPEPMPNEYEALNGIG